MNILDKTTNELRKVELPCPLYDFSFLGVSIFIWKKFTFDLFLCETFPYESDGKVPLIFIQIGYIEVIFESSLLYKKLYKRKYGFNPKGLLNE